MKARGMKTFVILALTASFSLQAKLASEEVKGKYKPDPAHSTITFKIRHIFTKVPGKFTEFDGEIYYDPDEVGNSWVNFKIEASSIDTGNKRRDRHLRSKDFFEVKKYPYITFKSTKVKKVDDNRVLVEGELTIKGTTKKVVLPVEILGFAKHPIVKGKIVGAFDTALTIDRQDFGITWNKTLDTGGTLLGNDVEIEIHIEALK